MVPEIFFSACYDSVDVSSEISKLYTFQPAVLHGYCRRKRRYADSPGITEDLGHQVAGVFVTGLTDDIMIKLDYFEGREYHRRQVRVKLAAKVGNAAGSGNLGGETRAAEVYVFNDKRDLEQEEWDFKQFLNDRLLIWTKPGYVQGRKSPQGFLCLSHWLTDIRLRSRYSRRGY